MISNFSFKVIFSKQDEVSDRERIEMAAEKP